MHKYNTAHFKKSTIIYIKDQIPKDVFYIITKGKAISYGTFNYNVEFNQGDILGLVNILLNEPYFFNVKAMEDVEAIEVDITEVIKTKNEELMVKIAANLDASFETWLGRYYMLLSENKEIAKIRTKEEIMNMADIYKKNEFKHVAYKLYNEYMKLFPENADDVKDKLSEMTPIEEPQKNDDNVYYYKKGYCLYTELEYTNKLYIIKSGEIGIYNIVNLGQVTRAIYSKNNMIDGYKPVLQYQPLSTCAVALEDSYIKVLTKKELINITENDPELSLYYIKMVSVKIRNTILKLMVLSVDDLLSKLLITLYYMLKTEILPEDVNSVNLLYTLNDIKTLMNIKDVKLIERELNRVRGVSVSSDGYINITDIKSLIIEYRNCINRLSNTHHHSMMYF
ncbi:cyclic nucleotide-binding domain-containing protein [Brachyspira hampsonii]|uniref:cAMP-binding protein n=1 Tax=Brachyspira hampsonii TaxID=1287055 RepID=A0AAC9TVV3_9SPIR|nr:cyclic nucleotide-binding domain-containing protein [Brachyspira hampsonii]ASJ22249.1 cAMP-binding protein [Brachyspira hampsonii]ELV06863.1 Crp/Fnr family transcriptional regulator [Brachyspira hampsonii 30599]OEJ19051.1 cAMP-binding protein [Brachyspira hampsonii]